MSETGQRERTKTELIMMQTGATPSDNRAHKTKNLDAAAHAAYLSTWVTWGQEDSIFAASLRNLANFRPSWE